MKISSAIVASFLLFGSSLYAEDFGIPKFGLKFMSVLHDKSNNYAPAQGSGYLVNVGYVSPDLFVDNLKVDLGFYANGDAGLTDWDSKHNKKYAGGLVSKYGGGTKSVLGTLKVDYKSKYADIRLGRGELDTPLTKIQASLTPNFYEAYQLILKPFDGLELNIGHISKISFGARAATDFGLIGEGGTTGGAIGPFNVNKPDAKKEQSYFYNMGEAAGVTRTNGRSFAGLSYSGIKNFDASFWVYHSDKIVNDYYSELGCKMPLVDDLFVKLNAQYLKQKDTSAALAGQKDFTLYGAKITFGSKDWSLYLAANESKDSSVNDGFFNAWGADPAYTSTIFSRNAYRDGVEAYGAGGEYMLLKNLKLLADYAHYSKSDTKVGVLRANRSAYELDIGLNYKPTKELLLRVFNSQRVSEYDGLLANGVKQRRQNHYRAVVAYSF